jgi:long-chain acyl-CoA synthetase
MLTTAAFWMLNHPDEHIACIELATNDVTLHKTTYGELKHKTAAFRVALTNAFGNKTKTLGFILAQNCIEAITAYLACLQRSDAAALLNVDATSAEATSKLVALYHPDWIARPASVARLDGYRTAYTFDIWCLDVSEAGSANQAQIHADLAILLSTSGSTGSPKFSRLSSAALASNALAISEYLEITRHDKAPTVQPMAYSFGMSIINSHLQVGACLLLSSHGVMAKEFWDLMRNGAATSFSGVPYTYQILRRIGFETMELPALRTLTQAGGRMDNKLIAHYLQHSQARNQQLFIMYGQTEASPRISYVPPQYLSEKIGSIGIAIPGGKLSLDPKNEEIIYVGANVMMGYASTRSDLSRGDDCGGRLATGDCGRVDNDGYYYIEGRIKRFIKLLGNRVNLDEVELQLEQTFAKPVACAGTDDKLSVWIEDLEVASDLTSRVGAFLHHQFKIHPTLFRVHLINNLPRLSSGKKDYGTLTS